MKSKKNIWLKFIPIIALSIPVLSLGLTANSKKYDVVTTVTTRNNTPIDTKPYLDVIDKPIYILNQALYKNSMTIMIAGDAFKHDEQDTFFEESKKAVINFFKHPQFAALRNYINVYLVFVESNQNQPAYRPRDTYFETSPNDRAASITDFGRSRAKSLENQIKNFVGHETYSKTHILINSTTYGGRGFLPSLSLSSLHELKKEHLFNHEFSHTLGLSDEYQAGNGLNVSTNNNFDTIRWKEFIGYNGVTISEKKYQGWTYYAPIDYCLMNSGHYFDEVCKFESWKNITDNIKLKELYVGVPSITETFDTQKDWNNKDLNRETLEIGEMFEPNDNSYELIKNKKIDMRTIIHNPFDESKIIKLKLDVSYINGGQSNQTIENTFTINPNETKQIKLTSTNEINFTDKNEVKIVGQVLDEKGNILSDSSWGNKYNGTNLTYHTKETLINFLDENGNKLPFMAEQKFFYNDDNKLNDLQQIDIPGYEKVEATKNSDGTLNWSYKKQDFKKVTIQIKDSIDETLIEEKHLKFFKNNKLILDSGILGGTKLSSAYYYINKLELDFNDYEAQQDILLSAYQFYKTYWINKPENEDVVIQQGDTFNLNDYVYITVQKDNQQVKNPSMSKYLIQTTSSNLDVNKPGQYQVSWNNDNISYGTLYVTVKPKDGYVPPEQKPEEPLTPILPPTTVPPTEIIPPPNKPDNSIPWEPIKPPNNDNNNDSGVPAQPGEPNSIEPWQVIAISVASSIGGLVVIGAISWFFKK